MQVVNPEELARLADKKLKGTITASEQQALDRLLVQLDEQDTVQWDGPDVDEHTLKSRLLAGIRKDAGLAQQSTTKQRPILWRAAAVLALIAAVSMALVWTLYPGESVKDRALGTAQIDLAPGVNGAVLILDSGRQVKLDSVNSGALQQLASQGITIKNGALYYNTVSAGTKGTARSAFNTLSTPYGKQFKVILPDGTQAWLNAGSTLKYPTDFSHRARAVEMSGEVYFEVAKAVDPTGRRLPFQVHAGSQVIEVLGTHFDVQAYKDDPVIKTTLTEGSVRVKAKGVPAVKLKPGQQSIVQPGEQQIRVKSVDAQSAISWTRGIFSFQGATIQEVMRQLARWYDVDVVYAAGLPNRRFSGKIYRNLNASSALEALSFMQLHFEITKQKTTPGDKGQQKQRTLIKVTP